MTQKEVKGLTRREIMEEFYGMQIPSFAPELKDVFYPEKDYKELRKELAEWKEKAREIVRRVIWKIAEDEGGQILHYNEWVDNEWEDLSLSKEQEKK